MIISIILIFFIIWFTILAISIFSDKSVIIDSKVVSLDNNDMNIEYEYNGKNYGPYKIINDDSLKVGDDCKISIDKNHPENFQLLNTGLFSDIFIRMIGYVILFCIICLSLALYFVNKSN